MNQLLTETFLEMLRLAATDLPPDVEDALKRASRREQKGSAAANALKILIENIASAREQSRPMCQDTGTNSWWITRPADLAERDVVESVHAATVRATKLGYLRPNTVDSVSGVNSGDNIGLYHPVIHCHEGRSRDVLADVLLKGGGCENVSAQMALPDVAIGAGRDLEGVRRSVLKMVEAAQGRGCSPGALGICIGGDRVTGYTVAKMQLMRLLDDTNPDPALERLEKTLLREANTLEIGPMGFGGKTTIISVKAAKAHRLPASFFVTMAYSCWSLRRAHARIRRGKASYSHVSFTTKGA